MQLRLTLCLLIFIVELAQAEIENWQTGLTIPGTENITPGPGSKFYDWNTANHNLQYADLSNKDLAQIWFYDSWLGYADFSNSTISRNRFY